MEIPQYLGFSSWYGLYFAGIIGSVITETVIDALVGQPLDHRVMIPGTIITADRLLTHISFIAFPITFPMYIYRLSKRK